MFLLQRKYRPLLGLDITTSSVKLIELAMAAQNRRDRARGWHIHRPVASHHSRDLATSPRVVTGSANAQNLGLYPRRRPRWAAQGPARAIGKPS